MIAEVNLVKIAMERGLAGEILRFVTAEGAANPKAFDMHSERIVAMAIMHLRFIVKYGFSYPAETIIRDGRRVYAHYPEAFRAWLTLGCPGIHREDLEALFDAYQINT